MNGLIKARCIPFNVGLDQGAASLVCTVSFVNLRRNHHFDSFWGLCYTMPPIYGKSGKSLGMVYCFGFTTSIAAALTGHGPATLRASSSLTLSKRLGAAFVNTR